MFDELRLHGFSEGDNLSVELRMLVAVAVTVAVILAAGFILSWWRKQKRAPPVAERGLSPTAGADRAPPREPFIAAALHIERAQSALVS